MKLYMIINIVGLALDLCGFIGIYLTKLGIVSKMDNRLYEISRYTHRNQDISTITREIIDSVNRKLESINELHQVQDKKTLKYFGIVIIGVILQISSLFVYFCQNKS
jgi:hypothetical protein